MVVNGDEEESKRKVTIQWIFRLVHEKIRASCATSGALPHLNVARRCDVAGGVVVRLLMELA